ncbi:MAG TPA: ABC transporter permease subunit [Clostridia bacterium]|nr:ABC transporter permease subunit [Clostridia bacterium]
MKNNQGFLYELKKHRALYILMFPGLLLMFINNYIPMLGTVIAFKRITYGKNFFETYIKSPFVGLKNFEFFLKTNYALIITRNTVLFNLAFIVIGLILAVTAAICLNEVLSKKLFKFYQSSMILPNMLSWVIISLIVYSFIADKGFINSLLTSFGGKESIQFYNETKYWPFIIIAVQAWYFLGTSAVIYLSTITGINPELYESAVMDGANKWQQVWAITIPMLRSTMIFMVMVSLGNLFVGNFGLFYNVPRESGLLFDVTNVIDTYVYRSLIQTGDIEMAAAASFYQSVVGFVIVLVSNSIIRLVSKEDAVF